MKDILYTFAECLALNNEQGYEFGLVCSALREFGKVHVLLKQLLGKFLQIRNLRYCADSETSEVRVKYKRLCVSVADYANARCATFEPVECRFELSPEIRTLQIVDRACETLLFTVHGETATASSEV